MTTPTEPPFDSAAHWKKTLRHTLRVSWWFLMSGIVVLLIPTNSHFLCGMSIGYAAGCVLGFWIVRYSIYNMHPDYTLRWQLDEGEHHLNCAVRNGREPRPDGRGFQGGVPTGPCNCGVVAKAEHRYVTWLLQNLLSRTRHLYAMAKFRMKKRPRPVQYDERF